MRKLIRQGPIFVPPTGPPQNTGLSADIYKTMGQSNITRMLEDFYAQLDKSSIRYMFPPDMMKAAHKSALFFVTLLGGPGLYQEKYGEPMMRKRHFPFIISQAERDVWLQLFMETLEDAAAKYQFPKAELPAFLLFLDNFSTWMINEAPSDDNN